MRLSAALALLALSASPAFALNCYEDLGQTGCPHKEVFPMSDLRALSCENLWYVRNGIYNGHGYCFKTARAQEMFDNSDCSVEDAADLNLNSNEVKNIDNIKRVEKNKGCPK